MPKETCINPEPFDHEIDRTLHRLRREKLYQPQLRNMDNLENQREIIIFKPLWDFIVPQVDGVKSFITKSSVNANNFELKSTVI